MKIAHISDLHVGGSHPIKWVKLLNKRISGYANFYLRRSKCHLVELLQTLFRYLRSCDIDHLFVTGDLTNFALESEFDAVRDMLSAELCLPAKEISMVPGNHDMYTRGSFRSARFLRTFARHMKSELLFGDGEGLGFPYVKLRGPYAIIGLSTAVPRPLFVASGEIGEAQLVLFSKILEHPDVKWRTPLLLGHHPLHPPRSAIRKKTQSLYDAYKILAKVHTDTYYFHGHVHRRMKATLSTNGHSVFSFGATSASLRHSDKEKMAGINIYQFDDEGRLSTARAHVLSEETGLISAQEIPTHATW